MAAPSTPPVRLRSLDGLRGFAAAVVLLHHLSMTIPAVSAGYDSAKNLVPFSFAWWAVATPLKIVIAGPEFVLVFFVLSGFVLSLAPLAAADGAKSAAKSGLRNSKRGARGQRRYDWAAYFPRRIVRLGVPVVASMVLAFFVITTLPHPSDGSDSGWVTRQASPDTSVHNLITETLLIVDPNRPSVNPPLWSLTWEMWFSLLLPLAVFLALRTRRFPVLWGLFFCGLSVYGSAMGMNALTYLPAFALGALLGANAHRISAAVERWRAHRGSRILWTAIAIAGPLLSTTFWMLRPLIHGEVAGAVIGLRVPGAVLMVATVAFWPPAARLFGTKPLGWLGRISFSLYLVHSPIVVAFALWFGDEPWWIGAILSVAASLGLALLMYTLVERPSQHLASWAGHRASDALAGIRSSFADARANHALAAARARHALSGAPKPPHSQAPDARGSSEPAYADARDR